MAEKAPAGNDSLQTSTLYVPIPSPTAADFHTPLETPTALSIPTPEQQPTSSKKKNKKKKKKNAQTAAPEAPAVQPPTETVPHTFSEQIRQIEMLKEGGAPGTSTSASASASASAPAFQPRRNVNVLEEIGSAKVLPFPSRFPNVHELTEAQKSRSILGDVLGFMREKPGMHDLDPEKLKPWNQVNRMVRLSREDVEQIMDRPLEMEMEMDVAGAEVAGGRGGGGKGDGEGGGE